MASVADVVRRSLRLLGVLAAGETPKAEELADALVDLNVLLDTWANQRLAVFGTRRNEYTLTPNLSPHTVGPGGTFPYSFPFSFGGNGAITAPRPLRDVRAGIIRAGQTVETPLRMLTDEEYQYIADKTMTGEVPRQLWIEQTFPLANFWFWPVPTTAATLVLYTWSRISALTAADAFSLPEGYENALGHALALQLAPGYGVQVSQDLKDNAAEAVAAIKLTNSPDLVVPIDPALSGPSPYNIYTDGL